MQIIGLRALGGSSAPSLEACDVCIIGSGPAGSTIARELSGTRLRVTMLESGGFDRDPDTDALNEIESVGWPRAMDQWLVRNRVVGGSSHTWTGRCAAFDAIDFEERPWVPDSGWLIDLAELSHYLERTVSYLGLAVGRDFSDERFWTIAGRPRPASEPDPAMLLPFFWQFSRDDTNPYEYMRFGRHLAKRIGPNVTLVTHATVVSIDSDQSGRTVRSVEFAAPDGRRRTLTAGTIVLCAGGIENARLLLCSDSVVADGLGNGRGLVGRYLMDHPRGTAASFEIKGSGQLQKRFGLYNVRGNLFRAGLRLSPEVQRAERLLNCAAWLGEAVTADDPWHALKRLLRGKPRLPRDMLAIAANAGLFARGLKEYFIDRNGLPRKLDALSLDCMCEQRPDPDSRVLLSERRDKFGMRLSRIDWRIHDEESRSVRRTAELVAKEFARIGLPKPTLAEWVHDGAGFPPTFVDVAHPTGTTRMSADPAKGVVDANLQLHGIEGLYVAGSSVFPTAGHCTPTQMIVAMALRLSDRIKETAPVGTQPIAWATTTIKAPCKAELELMDPDHPTVLVTGATGRIGQVVVEDLIGRGYRARATTSRAALPANAEDSSILWRRMDLRAASAGLDDLVTGCSAVVHLAAEMTNPDHMQTVNVDGTRALAEAAERAGVRAFVYASSVAVYGSGLRRDMLEDAPVLTPDRDVRSEYWAVDQLRAYGRTKLGGELAIREAAASVRYVVFRPTVVVDIDDVIAIRDWGKVKRNLAAHRHAHHVYVRDVADAFSWAVARGLAGTTAPGSVETYNLGEDEFVEPTHADFMRKAYTVNGNARFHAITVPWPVDWVRDALKFRSLPLRNPLWRMRFPSGRLHAAGWRPPFGMAGVHDAALSRIGAEAPGDRPQ
jgi:choline dehydrogenase-like flavoprotein/nucleoside-diphosphate-sugar epimerase